MVEEVEVEGSKTHRETQCVSLNSDAQLLFTLPLAHSCCNRSDDANVDCLMGVVAFVVSSNVSLATTSVALDPAFTIN